MKEGNLQLMLGGNDADNSRKDEVVVINDEKDFTYMEEDSRRTFARTA